MAKPNHTTGAAEIYTRLSGDLVSTYASSVWWSVAPDGELPGESDKPMVVFDAEANHDETTFDTDIARLRVDVYLIRHARGSVADMVTLINRVIGDGSTYGLNRWAPSISGIGSSPLRIVNSRGGTTETNHAVVELSFDTLFSEG